MFVLSEKVTLVFALVQNAGMPDEEAERLIEEAALRAADEVRTLARQGRQTELYLMAYRKECDDRREVTARGNRLAIEKQEAEGRERNKKLKAVESLPKNKPHFGD